jgi:8-oxo-dGTP diphosphatase
MSKIIHQSPVTYAPEPNQATWIKTTKLPNKNLISACFGLITYKDKIVLITHTSRGLDLPGGHKEPGESALNCFKREIQEETGISELASIKLIAYSQLKVFAPMPEGYKYPYPLSFQCLFSAKALNLGPFEANLDSRERVLLTWSELKLKEIYNKKPYLFDLINPSNK